MATINKGQVIKGGDLMLFVDVDGTKKSIGFATSHTLSISAETTETSTKDSGGVWARPEVSTLSWTASTENLCGVSGSSATYGDLIALMTAREPISAVFALEGDSENYTSKKEFDLPETGFWKPIADDGQNYFEGKVIITSVEVNAPNGDNATFSVEFTGVGALTNKTIKKN